MTTAPLCLWQCCQVYFYKEARCVRCGIPVYCFCPASFQASSIKALAEWYTCNRESCLPLKTQLISYNIWYISILLCFGVNRAYEQMSSKLVKVIVAFLCSLMLAHSVTAEEPCIKVKVKVKFAQIFIICFFFRWFLSLSASSSLTESSPLISLDPGFVLKKVPLWAFRLLPGGSYLLFEGCLQFLETVLKISSSASYFWKNKGAYKNYKIS